MNPPFWKMTRDAHNQTLFCEPEPRMTWKSIKGLEKVQSKKSFKPLKA